MTKLQSIGVNVYYGMAPATVNPGVKYIVVSTINGVEDSDKNAFNGKVAVLLDVVALGNSVLNTADSESMVSSIKGLIDSNTHPDLSPDFYCVTTKLISDEQLNTITTTQTVLRRLLRYEHFIGQIN